MKKTMLMLMVAITCSQLSPHYEEIEVCPLTVDENFSAGFVVQGRDWATRLSGTVLTTVNNGLGVNVECESATFEQTDIVVYGQLWGGCYGAEGLNWLINVNQDPPVGEVMFMMFVNQR